MAMVTSYEMIEQQTNPMNMYGTQKEKHKRRKWYEYVKNGINNAYYRAKYT